MDNEFYIPGWSDQPEAVEAVASTLPFPSFGATPAAQTDSLPDHVYLWEAPKKVIGKLLPPRNQLQVGSCVAHGTVRAIEYTNLVEIANGEPEEFLEFDPMSLYGGSRVQIGGGKLGRQDGSVGAWGAKWAVQYGMLSKDLYGQWDLRTYTEYLCRKLGATGCPTELEPLAKKHPVMGMTKVTNWADAKKALAAGNCIAICSNQGFTMARDKDGFCSPKGIWSHCMCLCGYQTGRREGGRLDNSWGANAHTGEVGAGDPGPEGFWVEASILDKMLGYGDSWAFSKVEGFPLVRPRLVF